MSSIAIADNNAIRMYQGWNLVPVGIPVSGQCTINDYSAMYLYSPLENKYHGGQTTNGNFNDPSLGQIYSQYRDTYLTPGDSGTSAWFYFNNECDLTITGGINPQKLDMKLFTGWNFITISGLMNGLKPSEIFQNCNVEKIYGWDAQNQQWKKGSLENPTTVKISDIGTSAIVKVSSECTLSNGTANPPQLPN